MGVNDDCGEKQKQNPKQLGSQRPSGNKLVDFSTLFVARYKLID